MDTSLTENRCQRKRNAVYRNFGHVPPMTQSRKKAPRTTTQAMFMRRVEQEIKRQKTTRNAVCQRPGAPSQSTFNEVMNGSDPRLETVHQIAVALNVPVHTLFAEAVVSGIPYNVTPFPPTPAPTSGFIHSADRKERTKRKRKAKGRVS